MLFTKSGCNKFLLASDAPLPAIAPIFVDSIYSPRHSHIILPDCIFMYLQFKSRNHYNIREQFSSIPHRCRFLFQPPPFRCVSFVFPLPFVAVMLCREIALDNPTCSAWIFNALFHGCVPTIHAFADRGGGDALNILHSSLRFPIYLTFPFFHFTVEWASNLNVERL